MYTRRAPLCQNRAPGKPDRRSESRVASVQPGQTGTVSEAFLPSPVLRSPASGEQRGSRVVSCSAGTAAAGSRSLRVAAGQEVPGWVPASPRPAPWKKDASQTPPNTGLPPRGRAGPQRALLRGCLGPRGSPEGGPRCSPPDCVDTVTAPKSVTLTNVFLYLPFYKQDRKNVLETRLHISGGELRSR